MVGRWACPFEKYESVGIAIPNWMEKSDTFQSPNHIILVLKHGWKVPGLNGGSRKITDFDGPWLPARSVFSWGYMITIEISPGFFQPSLHNVQRDSDSMNLCLCHAEIQRPGSARPRGSNSWDWDGLGDSKRALKIRAWGSWHNGQLAAQHHLCQPCVLEIFILRRMHQFPGQGPWGHWGSMTIPGLH